MFVCFVPVCCFCLWGAAFGVGIHLYLQWHDYIYLCIYLYLIFLFACSVAASCLSLSLSVCPNSFNTFNSSQLICLIGWFSQIPFGIRLTTPPMFCINYLYSLIRWLGAARVFLFLVGLNGSGKRLIFSVKGCPLSISKAGALKFKFWRMLQLGLGGGFFKLA